MWHEHLRAMIVIYVVSCLAAVYIVFFEVFFRAWLHPEKITMVAINLYGEALPELLSLVLLGVLIPFAIFFILRDSVQAEKWRRSID